MGSLEERIRKLQEEDRARQVGLQEQARQRENIARNIEHQAMLQRNEEQRRQREEKSGYVRILDTEDIARKLEDIRRQVWQSQGNVDEDRSDSGRFVRLLFDFKTRIPETETKTWMESFMESYQTQGGDSAYGPNSRKQSVMSVKQWHDVIRPSYLEVGVNVSDRNWDLKTPALYVIDTDVDLYSTNMGHTVEMERMATNMGSNINSLQRTIQYKDTSGRDFHKEARKSKGGVLYRPTYSYRLESSFTTYGGIQLGLTPGLSRDFIKEFLDYNLALSCMLRQKESKLPSQLK